MAWTIIAGIIIAAAAIIAALVFYMARYEPSNFKLSKIRIDLEGSGSGSGNNNVKTNKDDSPILTILHLSDFHLRNNLKGRKLFKFVSGLKDLKVDFIFITGDLIDQDKNIGRLGNMLAPLKARYGKYAVLGAHDYYNKAFYEFAKNMAKRKKEYRKSNDIALLVKKLGSIGVEVLRNENRKININSRSLGLLEIIGVDDPVIKKNNIKKATEGITSDKNLKTISKDDFNLAYNDTFNLNHEKHYKLHSEGKIRIALIHTPDAGSIIELVRRGTDIIFGGHTHGGQVRLPIIGALISGCDLKTRFAGGLFYFKRFILYVSRGLGEGKYSQFRFYCPPEASLIRIYWKT